jgi:hypothetical protein
MTDLPGNSHKKKETAVPGASPKDKLIKKVVTGEVIQKKPSILAKVKKTFFGGDFSSVVRYIGYEVLLPAFKDLAVDTASKGVERAIYGDTRPRTRGSSGLGRVNMQYDTPLRRPGRDYSTRHRELGAGPRSRNDIGQILVSSKEEADRVLGIMFEAVEQYSVVSVADMYELLGMNTNFTDQKWGWTNLRGSGVLQTRDGYLLDLPPVEVLDEN